MESGSLGGRQKDSFWGVFSYSSKYLLAHIEVLLSEEECYFSIQLDSNMDTCLELANELGAVEAWIPSRQKF